MIPSFEAFMYPVLFLLKDGTPLKRDELRNRCALYMNFSKDELEERIKSNKKYKIVDRLQWATYYLLKAGYLHRPSPATDQITQKGLDLLTSGVSVIDRKVLRANSPEFCEFERITRESSKVREKAKKKAVAKNGTVALETSKRRGRIPQNNESSLFSIAEAPKVIAVSKKAESTANFSQDRTEYEMAIDGISSKCNELKDGGISELNDIINDFEKLLFRKLILNLFPKMGYATNFEDKELPIKLSHPISLSGWISVDELGLQKTFLVALNRVNEPVSQIDIQSMIGFLSENNIENSIYICTSGFTDEAKYYADKSKLNLILLDGEAIANIMMKFNIGVKTRYSVIIKDADEEYLFTRLAENSL
jgi:restriction system protein